MRQYQLIKWDRYQPNNKGFPDRKIINGYPYDAIICGPHAVERSVEYLSTREERIKELESSVLRW
jgi:hypothetical protein